MPLHRVGESVRTMQKIILPGNLCCHDFLEIHSFLRRSGTDLREKQAPSLQTSGPAQDGRWTLFFITYVGWDERWTLFYHFYGMGWEVGFLFYHLCSRWLRTDERFMTVIINVNGKTSNPSKC